MVKVKTNTTTKRHITEADRVMYEQFKKEFYEGRDYLKYPNYQDEPCKMVKPKDMKFDGGKVLAAIPFQDFPDAIMELIKVCTFGAQKYSRSSWKTVENAHVRYTDAMGRHFIDCFKEDFDPESEISHKAHLAWNALATLQLEIEEQRKNK